MKKILFGLILILIFINFTISQPFLYKIICNNGIVYNNGILKAEYPYLINNMFDESSFSESIITDNSHWNKNDTLVNSSCYYLNATSRYVDYGNIGVNFNNNFYVEGWISTGTSNGNLYSFYSSYGWKIDFNSNNFRVYVRDTNGTNSGMQTFGNFFDGWTHLRIEFDFSSATGISVYKEIGGSWVQQSTSKGNLSALSGIEKGVNVVRLGYSTGSKVGYYTKFKIGDLIQDTTYLYAPLSEGAGSVSYDVSGNGHHGTQSTTISRSFENDVFHYNIANGYTNYQSETIKPDINVPFLLNGDTLSPVISGWRKKLSYGNGNYHNRCRTKIVLNKDVVSQIGIDTLFNDFDYYNYNNQLYMEQKETYTDKISIYRTQLAERDNTYVENYVNAYTVHLFIIAGQSNAVGSGTISELQDENWGKRNLNRIWTGSKFEQYQAQSTTLRNTGFPALSSNVGIEAAFFEQYNNDEIAWIFKYAISGSRLYENVGDDWNVNSTGEYFDDMNDELQEAINYMDSLNINYEIKGFIWMQGETDSQSQTQANAYETNENDLIDSIRVKYGNIPIYNFMINSNTAAYAGTVRQAKINNSLSMSDIYLEYAEGYFKADSTHLTTAGVEYLGIKIANDAD